jgi:hypothetical protein
MAHSKHSFITICLVPVLMSASFGQVITRPQEYAKESRRTILHYAFTAKAKNAARALKFANYFVSENIYLPEFVNNFAHIRYRYPGSG